MKREIAAIRMLRGDVRTAFGPLVKAVEVCYQDRDADVRAARSTFLPVGSCGDPASRNLGDSPGSRAQAKTDRSWEGRLFRGG